MYNNTKDAYDLYVYYLALKKHFTLEKYDFFRYNGKIKASREAFEKRRDKYFFYKLSKRPEAHDLILANMIADPETWVGDLFKDEAQSIYKDWAKRKQSLTYMFRSDLNELEDDFNENFRVEEGQHPRLLRLYSMKRIGLETLVILTDLVDVLPYWESKISDTVLFPNINKTVKKVKPFIEYDKKKMKKIVLDRYDAI